MTHSLRLAIVAAALLAVATPLQAQTREGLMGDLLRDINDVQSKMVGLAKAMPQGTYAWRPSEGTRSTGEVFAHVASDNYFMPAAIGTAAPADTGITSDYKTTTAYEKRTMTRDQLIAELDKSFAFLKAAMTAMPDAKLNEPINVFGQKMTNRSLWVTTTTHLHEHLGQLIAYARSNKVTPPWSK
jgi:uncharacterized damage-inducible protein DinB